MLSNALLQGSITTTEMIEFTATAKGSAAGTCMEALCFATEARPDLGTDAVFYCAIKELTNKAPRVRWEAAKVLANLAQQHIDKQSTAFAALLPNTEYPGTVVRWSAALALASMLRAQEQIDPEWVAVLQQLAEKEEKNAIKKMYLSAIKAVTKER